MTRNTTARKASTYAVAALLAAGTAAGLTGPTAHAATAPAPHPTPLPSNPASGTAQATSSGHATVVKVAPGIMRKLSAAHISLAATGQATARTRAHRLVVRFPHTRTRDADRTFRYDGGLAFTRGSRELRLGQFRVHAKRTNPSISAVVDHDARARMFEVHLTPSGDADRISLNRLSAGQLNTIFGTHRFHAGQRFADVTIPHPPGDTKWTETIGVTITNHSRMTMDLVSADAQHGGSDNDQVLQEPKQTLAPGENTYVEYGSVAIDGGELDVTYEIEGTTGHTIEAQFIDPNVGTNTALCGSPSYEQTVCTMDHGWKTKGTWDFYDTNTSPITNLNDTGGNTFWISKVGSPSQLVQVNDLSTDDGGAVSLWTNTHTSNDLWTFKQYDQDNYGWIINANSGKCLEVNGTDPTTTIDQWQCLDTPNQLWKATWNNYAASKSDFHENSTSFRNLQTKEYLSLADSGRDNGTPFTLNALLDHNDSFYVQGLPNS